MTLKDILKYYEKPWEWDYVSINPNITMRDIENHPELPWNMFYFSSNSSMTIKDILTYPEKYWDFTENTKFLHDNTVFYREIKNDIKKRREKVKSLNLYNDLNFIVEKYIGYV